MPTATSWSLAAGAPNLTQQQVPMPTTMAAQTHTMRLGCSSLPTCFRAAADIATRCYKNTKTWRNTEDCVRTGHVDAGCPHSVQLNLGHWFSATRPPIPEFQILQTQKPQSHKLEFTNPCDSAEVNPLEVSPFCFCDEKPLQDLKHLRQKTTARRKRH